MREFAEGSRGRERVALWAMEALERREMLSAGSLDTTFGQGGRLTTTFQVPGPGPNGFVPVQIVGIFSSAIQADGKPVLAAEVADAFGGTDFAVARLNPDGTPDTSFAGTGIYIRQADGPVDGAFGVAIQSDQKIVAVGGMGDGSGNDEFFVTRLNTDGSTDSTFGFNGEVIPDFTPGGGISHDEARGVVIQPDGKIVVDGAAGKGDGTSNTTIVVARFNTDGSLDGTFGEEFGRTVTDLGGAVDAALGVALQPDGKIIATGTTSNDFNFLTLRYNSDGSLDDNWGILGLIETKFPAPAGDQSFAIGTVVTTQPDGKVLVGGIVIDIDVANQVFNFDFGLARYDADGIPDFAFGNFGSIQTDFGNYESPTSIAVAQDGKIVLAGKATASATDLNFNIVEVARYTPDGQLDPAFNGNGEVILQPLGAPGAPATLDATGVGFSKMLAAATTAPPDFNQFEKQSAAIALLTPGGGILLLATQGSQLSEAKLISGTPPPPPTGDQPDLVITLGAVNPGTLSAGGTGSVDVTITNNGTAAINGTTLLQLLFSTDAIVDAGDTGVGLANVPLALQPGQSVVQTVGFTLPAGAAAGARFVVARVNGDGALVEGNTGNNDASAGLTVTSAPPVATVALKGPAKAKHGKKASFTFTVTNITGVMLTGTMALALKIVDANNNTTDVPGGTVRVNLKKRKGKGYSVPVVLPATLAKGSYSLLVTADSSTLNPAGGTLTVQSRAFSVT